ncbi:phage tail tape measure protein (plasmid) [Cytobacillus spongiae]|uniref:phage tail tape measure protein n=1 Tax=Cytobacillus spongiae TaxID=2901381 RepID=UPI001F16FA82|nr:phage tail tape measure protein [Cytobacillus spongiae]UII58122.1 phage tail tape measure protein [Cytobacillus spongiae]
MEKIEGLSIGLDLNTLKIDSGLKDLKSKISLVNSEMKANMSAFDYADKSIGKYETRLKGLNKKLEVQREVVEKSRISYEKMVTEHGEGSKEAEKAATAYNSEVTSLKSLERYIERTTEELSDLRKEQQLSQSGWTKMGNTIDAAGQKLTKVGDGMKTAGKSLSMYLTAPLTGMTFAANRAFYELDEGLDNVTKATGATGNQLGALKDSFKNVYGRFPTESATLGSVLGEVNTRFAFVDKKLEDSSEKFLKFADITGLDATTGVQLVARAMGDAGIEADEFEKVLDSVAKAAQATGIGADRLLDSITKYGAPMRALGFEMDESIALFSSWELAGVNAEIAMSGLKQSISRWGKEGKDPRNEFKKTLKEIEKAPGIAEATALSIEAFGAKAGPDLADAIQGGRFEFEELLKTLESSNGTVDQTFDDTVSGSEQFQVAMQKAKVVGADLWGIMENLLAPGLDKVITKLQSGVEWYGSLSDKTKMTGIVFAGLVAALGPVIAFTGIFLAMLGNIISGFAPVMASIAKAGGLLKWLRLGFLAFTGPVGITIAVLTLLGTGFIALYKNSETFRSGIQNLLEKVKVLGTQFLALLQPAIESIVGFFKSQLEVLRRFWSENSATIIGALKNLGKFVGVILLGILEVIKFVMPFVLAIIKSIWANIQGVISGALNIIMGLIKVFSGLLTGDFKKMWEGVKQIFFGAIEFIWNFVQLMFWGKLLKGLGGFVKSFGSTLKGGWDNAIGGIKTFVGNAKSWFKSFVDDGLKKFNDLVAGAKALPGKISNGMKSMAGKVTEGVKAVANKMTETLGKGVNGVIGGVNWVLGKVGVKGKIALWNVPQYATGTDNHPGGPAVVGEKGRELAHVPGVGYTMLGEKGAQFLNLPAGTSVLPNKETESLLSSFFPAYAKGTGWLSSAWEKTKSAAGNIKEGALDVWSHLSDPNKLFTKALELFGVETPSFPSMLKDLGRGAYSKSKGALKGYLTGKIKEIGSMFGGNVSGSVKQWIMSAIAATGVPQSWAGPLATIAQKESGGNPRAINLWDINARNGIPSKGLMQTIDPTFNAYKLSGMNDIWNPVHNAAAAIRYIKARYGNVFNVPGIKSMSQGGAYRGYATGGLINNDGLYRLAEGGWPEWIIPTDPSKRTDAMKLLALAGKDISGNKRPGQLPNAGGQDDSSFRELLELTAKQNQILLSILQQLANSGDIDFRRLAQYLHKPMEEILEFNKSRSQGFQGRAY